MSQIELAVVHSEPLNQQVQRVMLRPSVPIEFQAGQYVALSVDSDDCRYYSIASPDMQRDLIELHIDAGNTSKGALNKLLQLKRARLVKLGGHAFLRKDSMAPLLLIAGGVGFSYVRSILLSSLEQSPNREIHLYWVAKEETQLYALEELQALAKKNPNFALTVVMKTGKSERGIDLLLDKIKYEHQTLTHMEVYIAGRFDTSHLLRDHLTNRLDATLHNVFSDAFA